MIDESMMHAVRAGELPFEVFADALEERGLDLAAAVCRESPGLAPAYSRFWQEVEAERATLDDIATFFEETGRPVDRVDALRWLHEAGKRPCRSTRGRWTTWAWMLWYRPSVNPMASDLPRAVFRRMGGEGIAVNTVRSRHFNSFAAAVRVASVAVLQAVRDRRRPAVDLLTRFR